MYIIYKASSPWQAMGFPPIADWRLFYDRDYDREVWFGDIPLKDKPLYHYYLFYDIGGGHTFHTPIDEAQAEESGLQIVNINQLETEGHEILDLLSCQFVDKVIALIQSGDYTLQMD